MTRSAFLQLASGPRCVAWPSRCLRGRSVSRSSSGCSPSSPASSSPQRVEGTAVTVATPAPTGSPTPTLTPASPTLPDRSRFATTFDPTALAVHAGLACIGGSNASYGAGRTYLIVSGRCPVPAQQQPALILKLEGEISTAIRATAITRDGGFAGGSGPNSNGATVMSWDYRSDGFEGSVYLVATRAGSDVHWSSSSPSRSPPDGATRTERATYQGHVVVAGRRSLWIGRTGLGRDNEPDPTRSMPHEADDRGRPGLRAHGRAAASRTARARGQPVR